LQTNRQADSESVQVGDRLLQIDGLRASGLTWGAIFFAMHRKPGEARTLLLERDDKQFTMPGNIKAF
jgi:C-terminal processing protease CtpA/Prc